MRFGSAKLSRENIENIVNSNISSKQIDVLLWLALRQDASGFVSNVKYKDLCADIGFSHQEFYDCMYCLHRLSFINIESRHNLLGWDIKINNNQFLNSDDDKKGYININRDFLFNSIFISLRANEKKITLKILSSFNTIKDIYLNINLIKRWLSINNNQLIKSYILKLEQLFKIIYTKNNNKSKKIVIKDAREITESACKTTLHHFAKQKIKGIYIKLKLLKNNSQIEELINIVNQYRNKHDCNLIFDQIEYIMENIGFEIKLINSKLSKLVQSS